MDSINFNIDGKDIEILIQRKKIKRLYLKVKKEGTILVSAPFKADMSYILDFLDRKKQWLKSKISQVHEQKQKNNKVFFMGEELDYVYVPAFEFSVFYEDDELIFTGPEWDDDIFNYMKSAWYKQQARRILPEIAREVVVKYNFPQDIVIKVRKMKARLGTCYSQRKLINLNTELIKMEIPVIEFVILHELCHIVHADHGKGFYELLTRLMPDWKERKKRIF